MFGVQDDEREGMDRIQRERETERLLLKGGSAVGRAKCCWLGGGAKKSSTPLPRGESERMRE